MKRSAILVVVALTVAAAAALVLITGGGESGAPEPDAPRRIVIYRGGLDGDIDTDPVVEEINRRQNVEIRFVTAPWTDNRTRINLLLSSGEAIDLVTTVDNPEHWAEQGAILPIDEYIAEDTHPYLYKLLNSRTFEPLKIDGRAYAVPQVTIGVAWGTLVRQDWLDEVGLAAPTNEEELFTALRTLAERDPTGTTTGFQFEGDRQIRRTTIPIMSMFGVPSSFWDQAVNFVVRGDTLHHIATEDNTRAALAYMNRLYNAHLINRDFPTMNSFPRALERYIMSGKASMGWVIGPYTQQAVRLRAVDPGAEVSVLQPLAARGYEFARAQGILRQSNVVLAATSEHPQAAVDLLEYFNSLEGRQLLVAGVPGLHWEEFSDDGFFTRIPENWERDYGEQIYHPLNFYLGQGNSEGYIPAADYDTFEEAQAHSVAFVPEHLRDVANLQDEYAEGAKWVGDANPFQFVVFPDHADLRAEVDEAIYSGWTRVIAAAEDEFDEAYRGYLDGLEGAGLAEWVALYQEYYDRHLR